MVVVETSLIKLIASEEITTFNAYVAYSRVTGRKLPSRMWIGGTKQKQQHDKYRQAGANSPGIWGTVTVRSRFTGASRDKRTLFVAVVVEKKRIVQNVLL